VSLVTTCGRHGCESAARGECFSQAVVSLGGSKDGDGDDCSRRLLVLSTVPVAVSDGAQTCLRRPATKAVSVEEP
jgi:hypothetical protein